MVRFTKASPPRGLRARSLWSGLAWICLVGSSVRAEQLTVGFAEREITPRMSNPVWMAGYAPGRRATGVLDTLHARCAALSAGDRDVALISVDLIGLPLSTTREIRRQLPQFDYVVVSSTHNHEGPDVIGIWGRTPFERGVDDEYVDFVIGQVVDAAGEAHASARPADALFGVAEDASLVTDHRLPSVKDGSIRSLLFRDRRTRKPCGIVVQWSCHPETLGARNTLLSADFPGVVVASLQKSFGCPAVYFSGALGGFLAPPEGRIVDEAGKPATIGDVALQRGYGEAVAELARISVQGASEVRLTPFVATTKVVEIPVENPLYRLARAVGVVRRAGHLWTGNYEEIGPPVNQENADQPHGTVTEVAYLQLGDLHVAAVPGEIYPELVLGGIENPPCPEADFPHAPPEVPLGSYFPKDRFLLLGLANDEIGYIIPRRQWDQQPPFAYGRATAQYGEVHSCGPLTAPIICDAFARCVEEARGSLDRRDRPDLAPR